MTAPIRIEATADDRPIHVLEVGGSHVTAATIRLSDRRFIDRHRRYLDPAQDADDLIRTLTQAAHQLELRPGDRWAVAMPGPFDYPNGVGRYEGVSKFDALRGVDLRTALAERIPAEPDHLTFVNDADAFLIGEWVGGAAQGTSRCIALTLGTGIGSSFLADGVIFTDGPGVPLDGDIHHSMVNGVPLEDVVSDRAITRAYRAATRSATVDGVRDIAALARQGDRAAETVLTGAFHQLGVVAAGWLHRFGGDLVVVGGSMTGAWDLIEPALTAGLAAGEVHGVALHRTADTERSALLGAAWAAAHRQSVEAEA